VGILLKVEKVYYSPKGLVLFKKNKKQDAILKDISFEINHREVLGIVGESGCGKTTLVKVIGGILKHENEVYSFSDRFSKPLRNLAFYIQEWIEKGNPNEDLLVSFPNAKTGRVKEKNKKSEEQNPQLSQK